jgi:hypothetical protein
MSSRSTRAGRSPHTAAIPRRSPKTSPRR